jgi:hypothetical protein
MGHRCQIGCEQQHNRTDDEAKEGQKSPPINFKQQRGVPEVVEISEKQKDQPARPVTTIVTNMMATSNVVGLSINSAP